MGVRGPLKSKSADRRASPRHRSKPAEEAAAPEGSVAVLPKPRAKVRKPRRSSPVGYLPDEFRGIPEAEEAWANLGAMDWLKPSERELAKHYCRLIVQRSLAEQEGDLKLVATFERLIAADLSSLGATAMQRLRRDDAEGEKRPGASSKLVQLLPQLGGAGGKG